MVRLGVAACLLPATAHAGALNDALFMMSHILNQADTVGGAWTLAGAYDATALVALTGVPEEERTRYKWVPSPGMSKSCGPAKRPDGLGVFEAEQVGNQLAPTLGVMLKWTGDGPFEPLRPEGVRVSIGLPDDLQTDEGLADKPQVRLHPMIEPRSIAVRITGPGEVRYKQVVRTQLEMELCMEHKTGRGWNGGDSQQLRQAFLLDPPNRGLADRKYFGGQTQPVPALLGPPEACLFEDESLRTATSGGGQGEGRLELVPTDIWGAGLRWCAPGISDKALVTTGLPALPLRLGQLRKNQRITPPAARHWTELEVDVGEGSAGDVLVNLTYGDEVLLGGAPLFSDVRIDRDTFYDEPRGLIDLLAAVPYEYPSFTIRDARGEVTDHYTLLLVPNWQVVEAMRRMHVRPACEDAHGERKPPEECPLPDAGKGLQDGVGWLLAHPEWLFIQVPSLGGRADQWMSLSDAMGGGTLGWRNWGYMVGMLGGREPIGLPGIDIPTWGQVASAQRAPQHSLFLGSLAVLFGFVWLGARRAPDGWVRVPEERVAYWPGPELKQDTGGPPEAPEVSE